jgi:hypothetical protein
VSDGQRDLRLDQTPGRATDAADFAILNEAAVNVWLDIDFHLFATKRTRDNELVCHSRQSNLQDSRTHGTPTSEKRQISSVFQCGEFGYVIRSDPRAWRWLSEAAAGKSSGSAKRREFCHRRVRTSATQSPHVFETQAPAIVVISVLA